MEEFEEEGEYVNNNDSNFNYSDISEGGWISWFCQLEGNEFLVEIDEDFISNSANLFGLSTQKRDYKY